MENDIKKKLKAPLDSIISAQEITLCIILKVPQQIWLSNVCNASLLKTFISHSSQKFYLVLGQQQNLIQLKNSWETQTIFRWETKLSKQKAKWATAYKYQQHNKIYVCVCTPIIITFYNVLMITWRFTTTHLKTGPQQRT